MSKKNDNTPSLADVETQEEKLTRELEKVRARRAVIEKEKIEETRTIINGLPATLGVPSLVEVIGLIRQVNKGTYGLNKPVRSGKRISDEVKAAITAELQAGGKMNEVATKFGVSTPTVFNLKKAAGLVQTRGNAVAAPVAA